VRHFRARRRAFAIRQWKRRTGLIVPADSAVEGRHRRLRGGGAGDYVTGATDPGRIMRSAIRLALCTCVLIPTGADADDKTLADFYAGKTVTISVGFSAGGIFDLYARMLSRHIGQYIPGKPRVIVQNVPGAGGRRLANLFNSVGPHDGTAIGITTPGIVTDQVMQTAGVKYDLRKFHWIGAPADEVNVLWVWHTTPVKTLADVKQREVSLSSTGHGSPNYFVPRILNELIGTKFRIVTGYPGANEADLAIERGEVSGRVSGWTGLKNTGDWVASGKVNVLVQQGLRKAPELKDKPLLPEVGITERDRQVFEFLSLVPALGRPFFMPPGTPPERAAAIRRAFAAAMKDQGFLAEAKKGKVDVAPLTGEEMQAIVAKSFSVSPDVLATAKKAMK
jgi:tripartite-type tricarboxylate transporter receptor subunit TctC